MTLKETAIETFSFLLEAYVKTPELLKALSQNDFSGCFEAWKTRVEWCVSCDGNLLEGENISVK
jgi:hypothetical protein